MYRHTNHNTCSRAIDFDVQDGIITACQFIGGCNGNTQGIAKLVIGHHIDDVIQRIEGIDCGGRGTSCPDQLAQALKQYKIENM